MEVKPYNPAIVAIICQSTFAAVAAFGLSHTDPLSFSLMTQTIILVYGATVVISLRRPSVFHHLRMAYMQLFGNVRSAMLSVLSASAILGSDILLYIALTMSPKVDAYVIQTIWPVLAIAVGSIFVRGKWEEMPRGSLFLVFVSFLSAATIVSQGLIAFDSQYYLGYLAALGCALCGGIFTVVNPLLLDRLEGRSPYLSSVTLHLLLRSLTVPAFALALLSFSSFSWSTSALPFAIWVGVIVWGIGGSLWTVAFSSSKNLSLASLPYFVSIGNVFFLFVLHSEPVTVLTLISGAIILAVNILLHSKYRYFQTDKISILGAIIVSIIVVYSPDSALAGFSAEPIFVGSLFGIISAFTLNRLVSRNQRSKELFAELSADISAALIESENHNSSNYIRDNFDTVLCCLVDYECADSKESRNSIVRQIFACEANIRRCLGRSRATNQLRERFESFANSLSQWVTTRTAGVAAAEVTILYILALVAIVAIVASQAGTLWGDAFSILTSISIIFLLATIRDQNRSQMPQSFAEIIAQQRLLNRCGFDSYLPRSYVESGQLPSPTINHRFRCSHRSDEFAMVRKQPFLVRQLPRAVILFIFALIGLALLQKYDALDAVVKFLT